MPDSTVTSKISLRKKSIKKSNREATKTKSRENSKMREMELSQEGFNTSINLRGDDQPPAIKRQDILFIDQSNSDLSDVTSEDSFETDNEEKIQN